MATIIGIDNFTEIFSSMWSIPHSDPPIFEEKCLQMTLRGIADLLPDPSLILPIIIGDVITREKPHSDRISFQSLKQMVAIISLAQSETRFSITTFYSEAFRAQLIPPTVKYVHFGIPRRMPWIFTKCQNLCGVREIWSVNQSFEICKRLAELLNFSGTHISSELFIAVWGLVCSDTPEEVNKHALLVGAYMYTTALFGHLVPRYLHQEAVDQIEIWMAESMLVDSASLPVVHMHQISQFLHLDAEKISQKISQAILQNPGPKAIIPDCPDPAVPSTAAGTSILPTDASKETESILDCILSTEFQMLSDSSILRIINANEFHVIVNDCLQGRGPGPNTEALTFDMQGPSASGWNLSVAWVFVTYFLSNVVPKFPPATFPEDLLSEDIFLSKVIRHIHRRIVVANSSHGVNRQQPINTKRRKRCQDQKGALYVSRQDKVMANIPPPNPLWDILEVLGPDGMSSDETDTEGSPPNAPRFLRIPQIWCRKFLDSTMSQVDEMPRQSPDSCHSLRKGQPERIRIGDHTTQVNSTAIKGLPIDIYDEDWLMESGALPYLEAQPAIELSEPITYIESAILTSSN
ncbi:hypothetical protein M422DRAFT_255286 [Sphaerobolus stellatus SS14]|uniref:Uncharacterized protein n=1 Tax=Sphaerobolus stellatus (strain SS14) TaxID=990650 RepID=A0A0C9VU13_SPHS4|nr:hypothetical protein M422DRAFT_255286 [Sphaerobolus stellatus SS14]